MVEPVMRIAAADLEFHETGQIEYGDALGDGRTFTCHGGMPGRPPERQFRFRSIAGLREIYRALPSAARTEASTLGAQPQIARRGFRRPARGALLVGIADAIFVLIGLDRLREYVFWIRVFEIAARIERPHIPLGLP